jgi:predicted DNA-binding protein (MmcQ/YjbR family)
LVDEAELRARIGLSYDVVRASLPKKVQAALGR